MTISKGYGKNVTMTLILSRMVGWIEYKFTETNTYMKTSFDALSHNTSVERGIYAPDLSEDNTLTLNPQISNISSVNYIIVNQTRSEMAWQKVGTTYSKGIWGTNYRHFKHIEQ